MSLEIGASESATGPTSAPAGARKRRILFWSDAYYTPAGGTEGQILQLIRGLPEGYEAELWITHESEWLASNPFPCRTRSLHLGSLSNPLTWWHLRTIRREIRDGAFDLIQTYMCDAGIVGPLVARKLGIPVLVARRDMGFWYTPKLVGAMRRSARFASGFVANSEAVKRLTVETEHVPSDDVAVVRNGQDLATFDCAGDPEIRPRLGIPADARLVGLLANFKPLKRHVDLVDALARLAKKHPTLHVLFLGIGPHEDVLARAREKAVADRIHVHYAADGAIPYVKELEIGVLCSESEGFSNAILEYMGCALPVVATAVGGNPELVEEGCNGFLYEVGDTEKLAKHLDALLTDGALAARMGAASRERLAREFALDRMVSETISVYRRALGGQPVGGGTPARTTPTAATRRPTIEVVRDRAALDAIADAWRAMLPANGFFVGPEWVLSWFDAAAAGALPEVLVARDGGDGIVGLLPMARRGGRLALPGTDDGADHLDVAAAPGRADEVADAILDHWLATRAGRLELRHLAEDGALRRAIHRRRWTLPYAEALSTRCPYIAASSTFDSYLARFSAKHRGNLKRQVREVRESAAYAVDRSTGRNLTEDVEALFDLHQARFDRFGGRTSFGGPRVRAFHQVLAKRLAERRELALTRLLLAGRPIAMHYGFRVGGKLYHFQGGFDPDAPISSPGTVLTTIVLEEDVFGAGLAEYDFLDGTEAYKLSLATGERRLYDVRLYRPSFLGRARALTRGALHLVRRLVRRRG